MILGGVGRPICMSSGRRCSSSTALGTPKQHPNAARQRYLDETVCSQSDLPSNEHLKNRVLTGPSVTSITIGSRTFRCSARFLNHGSQPPNLPSDSVM